jgi:hypothetical protein
VLEARILEAGNFFRWAHGTHGTHGNGEKDKDLLPANHANRRE